MKADSSFSGSIIETVILYPVEGMINIHERITRLCERLT